jgi:hypothetical protein
MFLIAGGQFDPNMKALSDNLVRRGIPFYNLLVGPDSDLRLRIDIQTNSFELNGEQILPTGCFIRHDVFLYQTDNIPAARASALNWYQAVRGWLVSQPSVRLFNRYSYLRENNKIQNLLLAQETGLAIPRTIVANDLAGFGAQVAPLVQKPVAGGEYTALLSDLQRQSETARSYPRFVQPRLNRPEMRIYRIGPKLIAFWLHSSELDYRRTQDVEIQPASVPTAFGEKLVQLCDRLELDFAAADFMADDDGELRFLEVNSQPMFAAFDRTVEGQICNAIIDHLSESTASSR